MLTLKPKKVKNKLLFFLLLPCICFSQEMIFRGKVVAHTDDLKGILVVNLTKETQTQTDSLGRFRIKAEEDDLLIFTAVHLWKVRHLVEKTDFDKENIIPMEVKAEMLDVVEIVRYNFNPEDLGIVPRGQKRYTLAERRLYTAGRITIGTVIDVDAIINAVSGRTKMLKQLVKMEREDKRVVALTNAFTEEFFTETLKIQPENVEEFKYFSVYYLPPNLPRRQLELRLIELAEEYLKLRETLED